MGKNRASKKKNVFKVAGAKSLKPKIKAKPFAGNLKRIKEKLKENVRSIDAELSRVDEVVRRQKKENSANLKSKNKNNVGDAEIEKKISEENQIVALQNISKIKL